MARFSVELREAVDPLVLAVDVGSTGSRGGVYDARGLPVAGLRHKVPHSFTTAADGTSVIDPLQVLAEVEGIRFCTFTEHDVVRHPLVQQVVQAYDAYQARQEAERARREEERRAAESQRD